MARGKRILPSGPSRLSLLVAHLKAPPKLTLPYISSLRLTLASRNDHFGARHFLKEQLPRIRYANPDLDIEVRKIPKRPKDEWRPELKLSFYDGNTQTLNLHARWSTAIVRELMDSAGSPAWARWKAEVARSGLPLVPGAEPEAGEIIPVPTPPRFSFDEWHAKHPRKVRRRRGEASPTRATKAGTAVQPKRKDPKQSKTKPVPAAQTVPAVPERTPTQMLADAEKAKQEDEKRRAAKKEARRAKLDAPRKAEEEAERRVALELLAKPRTGAAAVLP
ncbi:hypothetical protein DFH09DRAFT_990443 [Mycena vulgaris]|nr:hypothetical protein DFH09DRAFT_990443 [Mycena vulgaris]